MTARPSVRNPPRANRWQRERNAQVIGWLAFLVTAGCSSSTPHVTRVVPPENTARAAGVEPSGVVLACHFGDAWVSLVPVSFAPDPRGCLMWALIAGDWGGEWERFEPFRARACPPGGVAIAVPPGDYWLLGTQRDCEAGVRQRGVRRRLSITAAARRVDLTESDITFEWGCTD